MLFLKDSCVPKYWMSNDASFSNTYHIYFNTPSKSLNILLRSSISFIYFFFLFFFLSFFFFFLIGYSRNLNGILNRMFFLLEQNPEVPVSLGLSYFGPGKLTVDLAALCHYLVKNSGNIKKVKIYVKK